MFVHRRRGWEIPENRVTPESIFLQRRTLAKALAAGPILAASAPLLSAGSALAAADPSAGLYPVKRNPKYAVDRALTPERIATTYNNFYEFASDKRIYPAIDLNRSSTRKEELLLNEVELNRMYLLRNFLSDMPPAEAIQFMIERMRRTDTNQEFLDSMAAGS